MTDKPQIPDGPPIPMTDFQLGDRYDSEDMYRDIAAAASNQPLYEVIEDAIWQALDSEQAMPHSGVDPSYVVSEFLRLLAEAGYTVTPTNPT
jgi:hypothetical protein